MRRVEIGRREMLAGSAGLLLHGCAEPRRNAAPQPVSIVKVSGYGADIAGAVRRILPEHGLEVRGKRILLKPNLVEFERGAPINTHAAFVSAVMEALRALGASDIRIGEGPANRPDALEIAEAAGYFEAIPDFESRFIDLNYDAVVPIPLQPAGRASKLYVARSAFAYDLVISLPKMKTHHWAGVTLAMKNLFGFVPGSVYGFPKNHLHWSGIPECVAGLHAALPLHFSIVDGIVGMEGNGPLQGRPKAAGVVVAGRNAAAVDATCCRIMRIDPAKIRYLQLAGAAYLDESAVRQIGEPVRSVSVPFDLIPEYRSIRLERV
jgi:uncharacterized protein (DUF362 family)